VRSGVRCGRLRLPGYAGADRLRTARSAEEGCIIAGHGGGFREPTGNGLDMEMAAAQECMRQMRCPCPSSA